MGIIIVDTLSRGSTGASPFPLLLEQDARLSYMTVADIAARDALETWQRSQGMRVHTIAEGNDYRLAVDLTTWTEVSSSAAFQLLSEKNQAGGYVGLEVDGFINPAYIKAIYANTSYVVADYPERNNLNTLTGDIIVVTGSSETFVKLNNNPPVNVDGDFSLLSSGGDVLSVNGDIGTVIIDFNSMIAQGGSQASFEAAVGSTPSVSANTGQIVVNTNDIATIYAILAGLGTATDIAIPEYSGGVTYTDGQNVVYGNVNAQNLYRVKNGQGPITSIIPTDTSKWERIGDFYTKDETDALLLNLVSDPIFNWGRTIRKLPEVGEIPGGNLLIDGLDEIYYGRIDTVVELLSIDPIQIGETIAPTINGKVTKGDALNIQEIVILDNAGNPVGNPSFVGTDEVIEFSFQVNTSILGVENNTLKYSIQVASSYDAFLPPEVIVSDTIVVTTVYPILFGNGAAGLDAANKYNSLQKLIEADSNKTLLLVSSNDRMYYCIPVEYADRVQILDETGSDLLGSFFPASPTTEQVDSSALTADWSHDYKVYQANYNTNSLAANLVFVIDPTLGVGNTLDDIEEGIINKHLTKSLKEKLINFEGSDYLTKAVYDTDDNGIVETASSSGTNAKNASGGIIPANVFVHVVGADPIEEALLIEIADATANKPAHGFTREAVPVGAVSIMTLKGFAGGISIPGGAIGDLVYLGNAGGVGLTPTASGLIQTIGTILNIDGGDIALVRVNPQDSDDRDDFLRTWRQFTPYEKDVQFVIDLTLIPEIPSTAKVLARAAIEDYVSSNDVHQDFLDGKLEPIGGDMAAIRYDPVGKEINVYDMDNMDDGLTETDPAIRKVTITEDQRIKLDSLQPSTFKGTFVDPDALRTAFPESNDGDSANVTSTGTVWQWDSGAPPNVSPPTTNGDWVDSLTSSGGDMLASVYDNAGKAVNVYDVDNHDNGVTNKVFTTTEQTKLTNIEAGATADQDALEIKTAYESNADTNAFTDANQTKLGGIEDGAKDDQDAAEVSFGVTGSTLISTIVQGAIDELDGKYEGTLSDTMLKTIYDTNDNGIVDKANNIIEIAENTELVNMNAGDVVYIDSVDGSSEKALFSSNNDPATVPITGIVLNQGATTVFAPGATIHIGISGVFQIPSFGGWVQGDSLYLGLAGQMQNTPPTVSSTLYLVFVAYISGVVGGNSYVEMINLHALASSTASFDPTPSTLLTTNVQDAIVELDTKVEAIPAAKASVMGTLSFDSVGGTTETVGEIALPATLSAFSPNTSSPANGRLAVDINADVTVTISVGGETVGNGNSSQIELAVNGTLQGIRSIISTGGNQATGAGMTVTHTLQLTAGDYVSVFLQGNSIDIFGVQITINGQAQ